MHNTEDKRWWVTEYRKQEDVFVQEIAPQLGLKAIINPRKETNPYVPDLIVDGRIADLKCQITPFFKSKSFYGIPNQYAITFNQKDYINYSTNYPDIVIYFWVNWKTTSLQIGNDLYKVKPMEGIWRAEFTKIQKKIENKQVSLHSYIRRENDIIGNGRDSYVMDCRDFQELYLKGEQ